MSAKIWTREDITAVVSRYLLDNESMLSIAKSLGKSRSTIAGVLGRANALTKKPKKPGTVKVVKQRPAPAPPPPPRPPKKPVQQRPTDRTARLMSLLEAAANTRSPCPSNAQISDALGISLTSAGDLFAMVEQRGLIMVQRPNRTIRIATIVGTGAVTAPSGNRAVPVQAIRQPQLAPMRTAVVVPIMQPLRAPLIDRFTHLRLDGCQWIEKDPSRDRDWNFCGATRCLVKRDGQMVRGSYCAEHQSRIIRHDGIDNKEVA